MTEKVPSHKPSKLLRAMRGRAFPQSYGSFKQRGIFETMHFFDMAYCTKFFVIFTIFSISVMNLPGRIHVKSAAVFHQFFFFVFKVTGCCFGAG